ncbi:autoinducer binding domain-containing protein [Shimia sp. R11_0]|uniref:autoinducer binding domain-containing protein n=1 Tax=Shimia sp. R11_0 TaxID=2821096 RepID=UPI001ADCBBB4|nr:autoinducer binding domain-containing protein [Shimia sp. R11_0]MBO9477145.1 autoinducer binding domain-containing protein [Shimia sp. R11_0]
MSAPFDIMVQLTEAPTLQDKHRLFSGFMEAEYGYIGVNYGLFLDTRSVHAIHNNHLSMRRGLPEEWREIYQRNRFAQDDFGMLMGALSNAPILQSNFYRMLDDGALQPQFARVISGVRDFVSAGIVLPLEMNGLRGIVGLFDPTGDIVKHDARLERDLPVIQALANQLHLCSDWSDQLIAQMGVSEMNLRVLRLKAQGLRVKEILHEIGRDNPKTVDNHMMRLRKVMGTRNDLETMQRAARIGLLKDLDRQKSEDVTRWAERLGLP